MAFFVILAPDTKLLNFVLTYFSLIVSVCTETVKLQITNWRDLVGICITQCDVQYWQNCSSFLPRCMECSRGIAMGILSVRPSVCLSVRLSVRLSVKRVHCDKTEESCAQIFISHERTFILVF